MEDALLPPKRQVAGSHPVGPTISLLYFQSLGSSRSTRASRQRVERRRSFLIYNCLVIHFTLVVNQAILGLAPLAAKIGAIERGLSKASGGVH